MPDVRSSVRSVRWPVFLDRDGRRWKHIKRVALALIGLCIVLAAVVVCGVVSPPRLSDAAATTVTRSAMRSRRPSVLPRVALTRAERVRLALRRRLFRAIALSAATNPIAAASRSSLTTAGHATPDHPAEVAGFYVNWDDNSLSSLRAHASQMDYVVCEWAFLAADADSLHLAVDPRVLIVTRRVPAATRARVMLMVSNYDSARQRFDAQRLRRFLGNVTARSTVISQIVDAVQTYNLGGVTIDFEEIPDNLQAAMLGFARELRVTLAHGVFLTHAVAADAPPEYLRALAAIDDRIFVMLYDEHYSTGDPGPVASQGWYERRAADITRVVPASKVILSIGAYGYDWNDGDPDAPAEEMTFQDVIAAARDNGATPRFDRASLTPYLAWRDADSTDHLVWYLDGVTAYNEMLAGRALHVAGHAVWRLGSEDPSLWEVLDARAPRDVRRLAVIQPGYDVQFHGSGEVLRVAQTPVVGRRDIRVDGLSGRIVSERIASFPTPFVVERAGKQSRKVALTFDDGPDRLWTAAILDTLRKYDVPATFFVVGENVEANIALTRRIFREGHEIGNHTFTHPNLALTSRHVTQLEITAAERVLEAVLNRRTVLFRPPYFGDAEPTTSDELEPVHTASQLGYVTAGVHVDSDDWRRPGAAQIVRNVLDRRALGNVVLLHDGGGDRRQTVAALGPLIDSLRARGDTLVRMSALTGLQRSDVMPSPPASGTASRLVALASYGVLGGAELALYWLLLIAAALGVGRLVPIMVLAVWQRFRRRPHFSRYTPFVSVIVPAYNEARVIGRTIASLLAQRYQGALEVIVVDDGSDDDTYDAAGRAFPAEPRLRVHRRPNSGKAGALNFGVAVARGDIVVALDADTIFTPDTVARLVAPLSDPRVGAVAGNAKVGNRINLVTRFQAVEYVTSQNLDRRAFSLLNCITVVPGAVGAWRKDLVREIGGFSEDTLAEDQDLTLALRRRGHRVAYADSAIAYTEAPDTFRGLAKQRFRWSFGTLQCMWKHRDALFRPRYGALGFIAMPNVWLFQLTFAALSPIADLMFVWSLVSVWLTRLEHGGTFALVNLEHVLTLYAIFLVVDWSAAMLAFLLEAGEDKRLTALILLQRFAYRQVMYWVVTKAFIAAARGHVVGWGKLERKATVAYGGVQENAG